MLDDGRLPELLPDAVYLEKRHGDATRSALRALHRVSPATSPPGESLRPGAGDLARTR